MGAVFRSESIASISLAGTALVLVGAALATRPQRQRDGIAISE
jgi:drug/metabolite transporter (DMT)-like permease